MEVNRKQVYAELKVGSGDEDSEEILVRLSLPYVYGSDYNTARIDLVQRAVNGFLGASIPPRS